MTETFFIKFLIKSIITLIRCWKGSLSVLLPKTLIIFAGHWLTCFLRWVVTLLTTILICPRFSRRMAGVGPRILGSGCECENLKSRWMLFWCDKNHACGVTIERGHSWSTNKWPPITPSPQYTVEIWILMMNEASLSSALKALLTRESCPFLRVLHRDICIWHSCCHAAYCKMP